MFKLGKEVVFFQTGFVPICAEVAAAFPFFAVSAHRQAVGVGRFGLVEIACAPSELAVVADVFVHHAVKQDVAAAGLVLEGFVAASRADKASAQAVFRT